MTYGLSPVVAALVAFGLASAALAKEGAQSGHDQVTRPVDGAIASGEEVASVPLIEADAALWDRLWQAVGLAQSLEIMAESSIQGAALLEEELFPGQGGDAWGAAVEALYTTDSLESLFEAGLASTTLSASHGEAIAGFFETDLGARIVEAELVAWRAILDPEIEALANQIYDEARAGREARLEQLERFTRANGLIDLNVMGSMTSLAALYTGLAEGEALQADVPMEFLLNQIWQQEPEIRQDTTVWLYSFQIMAYNGFSDEEMERYIAFSESAAGQSYNRVLFAGFDAIMAEMSLRLGRLAGTFVNGERL